MSGVANLRTVIDEWSCGFRLVSSSSLSSSRAVVVGRPNDAKRDTQMLPHNPSGRRNRALPHAAWAADGRSEGGTCVLVGSDVVADQGHTRGFGRAARRWAAWVEGGRKGGGKAATTGAGGGEEGRRRREGGGKAKEVMLSQDEGGRRVRLGVNRSTRGGGEQQADGFHDDSPPRQAGGQAGRAGQTLHSGLWGLPEAPSPHTYAGGTLCWALLRLGLGAVGRWNPPPVSAMKKANSARPGRYPPWAR